MMTLGQLIHELEQAKSETQVYFDFCQCVPTTIRSWRGIYSEPALGWRPSGYSNPGPDRGHPTVESLLKELRKPLHPWPAIYTGWKGGEFQYDEDSRLHIDNSGDYTQTEITGVTIGEYEVIIHTALENTDWSKYPD